MKLIALGFLVGCGGGSPAVATTPRGAPPADLAFYVGTWACEGVAYDDAGKETEKMALEVRVEPDITNWLAIHVYENGKPVTTELKGYDPANKSYLHMWASEDGTGGTLSSTGWVGNQLAFDEDHPDPKSKTRMTFTKLDDAHYTHRAETDSGAGYKPSFTKTCHRA